MTSKNLFWAEWMENVKRRAWTFVLCFAALFLTVPMLRLISLSSMKNAVDNAVLNSVSPEQIERLQKNMRISFASGIGLSEVLVCIAALFAVLFAVQGFSFLYDRRKMDLYMSVPVSGTKRFWLIWANGVAAFGACYFVNLILCWCAGAAFGVMTAELMADSLLAFLVNMLAFVAMYQTALLAVMLTGNVLTALLGCSVLFLYEYVVRFLGSGLKSTFFVSYCAADASRWMGKPWITPFVGYVDFCGQIWYDGSGIGGYYGNGKWSGQLMTEVLLLALFAVAAGLLVYLLFRKRRTESYSSAIAFPAIKPLLEFLMLVPFSAGVGALVGKSAGNQNVFLFAGAVIAALVGHAVIQLIYERELKAAIGKRGLAAVCVAAAAALLCVFRFDLTGYDSYLPKKEKIESVCVTLEHDYDNFGRENIGARQGYFNRDAASDLLERMNSQDPATIDAVLEMVSLWQQERDSMALKEARCYVVRYNLKDGRTVYRRFFADGDLTPDALNTVLGDPAYRYVRYQIYSEEFEQALEKMKIVYDDGKQDFLYTLDAKELLTTYREEFESYDYQMISGSLPCGQLIFTIPKEKGSVSGEKRWTYPVYGSFTATNALLLKNGILAGEKEGVVAPEDVKEIRVSYSVYDGEDGGGPLFEDGEVPEQNITCVFDDPKEMEQILAALYSRRLAAVAGQEFKELDQDYWYSVSLSLTEEAQLKRYDVEEILFLGGKTPDFVNQRIREAALRG